MPSTRGNRRLIEAAQRFAYPKRNDVTAQADMVMKGGITSGIVYPLAVCEIAKTYRLRNVGGSSAGGIAAAFAAAAERNRDNGGYAMLAGLPLRLGNDLKDLFQPSPGTAPVFGLLSAWIGGASLPVRVAKVARRLAGAGKRVFWPLFLGVLAVEVAVLLAATAGPYDLRRWAALAVAITLAAAGALAVALAVTTVVALSRGAAAVTQNGYGLCIGSNGERPGQQRTKPFADWMHEMLGEVAGLPGQVVCFRDLWGDDATREYHARKGTEQRDRDRAMAAIDPDVRLEMMTTNVTFARPMRVPWTTDEFLACPHDMRRWFPPDVAAALLGEDTPSECPDHPGTTLRKLPEPPDVPVVFAVRMTLSFPGLISAVPLYRVDYSGGRDNAELVRCWFSDGGISSNFPIHFFDRLLPRRPTFGVNLVPYHPAYPGHDVSYPKPGTTSQPRVRQTTTLGGFVGALVDTLQNWSDEAQAMLPGFRHRIVEVHLRDDEGGMNLYMPRRTVLDLATRGGRAGRLLVKEFDFDGHRMTRYKIAMSELQQAVNGMDVAYADGYAELLDEEYGPGSGEQRRTKTLLRFAGTTPDFEKDAPRPDCDLRITPHF